MPKVPARRPLSADRIVESALRLVDRHGLDGLSMRRLGAALRVEAMSLYKHVPNKGALVDLVVERVLAGVAPPPVAAGWEQRLRHVAGELRRVALAHPHVFPVLATRVPSSPTAFAPLETLLGALVDAGLDDDEAVRHFWTFVAWATGALLAETSASVGAAAASLAVPESLDPSAFPNLSRLGDAVSACDFATEYARGLDVLVEAARSAGAGPAGRGGRPGPTGRSARAARPRRG